MKIAQLSFPSFSLNLHPKLDGLSWPISGFMQESFLNPGVEGSDQWDPGSGASQWKQDGRQIPKMAPGLPLLVCVHVLCNPLPLRVGDTCGKNGTITALIIFYYIRADRRVSPAGFDDLS